MIVFLVLVLLLLGGCSSEKKKAIPAECPSKVSLICQKYYDVVAIDNIEVIIQNNLEKTIYFGEDYSLEKYEKNGWNSLPLVVAYNSIGFSLPSGAKQKIKIPLLKNQYEYKSGYYRIIKGFKTSNGEVDTVCAQFYLEKDSSKKPGRIGLSQP